VLTHAEAAVAKAGFMAIPQTPLVLVLLLFPM